MNIVARHFQVRSSAQKVRLIANLIRGKKVVEAFNLLDFSRKKSAFLVKKVLKSAVANAEHNNGINLNKLIVTKIFVNSGSTMKRMMPRAKGRSDRILKRTSHITVIVSNKKI